MKYKQAVIELIKENINSYIKTLPPEKRLKLLALSFRAKESAKLGAKLAIVAELMKRGVVDLEEILDEIIKRHWHHEDVD